MWAATPPPPQRPATNSRRSPTVAPSGIRILKWPPKPSEVKDWTTTSWKIADTSCASSASFASATKVDLSSSWTSSRFANFRIRCGVPAAVGLTDFRKVAAFYYTTIYNAYLIQTFQTDPSNGAGNLAWCMLASGDTHAHKVHELPEDLHLVEATSNRYRHNS